MEGFTQRGWLVERPYMHVQDGLEDVGSCLVQCKRGMKRALLEAIASRAVATAQDVLRFIKCTLLAATTDCEVAQRLLCSPEVPRCRCLDVAAELFSR